MQASSVFDSDTALLDAEETEVLPVGDIGKGLVFRHKREVPFSMNLVAEMANLKEFDPDRRFDKEHSNKLLRHARQGTFRWELVQLVLCEFQGHKYRMNGQHTCHMRQEFKDAPSNLMVTVFEYQAKTVDDMRSLYSSLDRGKPRSRADVINAYLFQSTEYVGFTKTIIKQIAEGLSFFLEDANSVNKVTPDDLSYLLKFKFHDLATDVGRYLHTCSGKETAHLRRSPVYTAMYTTFSLDKKASIEFWDAVKTGANVDEADPRKRLRDQLLTHGVNAGRGGSSFSNCVSGECMLGWCIQAWNCWRAQRPLKKFTTIDTKKDRREAV